MLTHAGNDVNLTNLDTTNKVIYNAQNQVDINAKYNIRCGIYIQNIFIIFN